ncbi:MAG: hypothetical protein L0K67_13530, partial [Brevibacterium sp.]|nr:hypothetical protein [Brevibacterium sp.]
TSGFFFCGMIDDLPILLDCPPSPGLLVSQFRGAGHEPSVRWLILHAETIRSMVGWGLGFSLANAVPHPDTLTFQGMPVRCLPVTNPEFANTIVAATMAGARLSK